MQDLTDIWNGLVGCVEAFGGSPRLDLLWWIRR